jgi:flagellar hook protein FlgE
MGNANVSASLNTNGNLVHKTIGANADTESITVGGSGAAAVGFGVGQNSFQPVNLLTQSAVAQGQTLTVTVGTASAQTITFGTGTNEVATLAQLQAAIVGPPGLTGVIGTVNTATGDITLAAGNPTATLTIGGTASASKFGIQNLTAFPAKGTVIGNDVSTFNAESIDGGSITAYDTQGNPVAVDFRWAKISPNSWQLFYQTNTSATGSQTAWQNVGTTFTFNANGQLQPAINSVTLNNLSVNGDALGTVQLQFGNNGLTQFANSSGTAQVSQLQQNGFAAGQLETISVDSQGRVAGTFSNGQTIPLAEITLATFNGQNWLRPLNGGAYAETPDSGTPIFGATGTIVGSSLESSNVDIATQFSQLIVAQQAYSANTRVMSTADQMIQSLLQVIQ